MLAARPAPLSDITNARLMTNNKMMMMMDTPMSFRCDSNPYSPEVYTPHSMMGSFTLTPRVRQHEPYRWKCLPDDEAQASHILSQRTPVAVRQLSFSAMPAEAAEEPSHTAPQTTTAVCRALVQFKCHQYEFSSSIMLEEGQFVVVQGDRGVDIGVVIRINTESRKSYAERTGPTGSVLRHATQREVDYWATELKAEEAAAVEFCQQRANRSHLPMEIRYAEFQFDKKKLTFYFESKSRVDFVQLNKELYREYGCRIWMEKLAPSHE